MTFSEIFEKLGDKKLSPEQKKHAEYEFYLLLHEKTPAFLSFFIVLAIGFYFYPPVETFLEKILADYILNETLLLIVILLIIFGPMLYLEEKIEKLIAKLIAVFYFYKYPTEDITPEWIDLHTQSPLNKIR